MNSEVPKWIPQESAVCFPNQLSEEASQNKTEEEEEQERCKRPRTTLDSEEGVEEFLVLLERIEEMNKHFKRKRTNCSGGGIGAVEEEDQMVMAMPAGMQQAQGLPDAVDHMISYNKSRTSPWKPSFQWKDFNRSNSLSAQTDLSCAAATEKNKDEEGRIQIGNGQLQAINFFDGDTPAECSHDHVDGVNYKDEDEDAPPELELQLFPI